MREWVLMLLVIFSIPFVLRRPLLGLTIYLGANIIRPEMLFWGGYSGSFVFKTYYILIFVGMLLQRQLGNFGQAMRREMLLMFWFLGGILLSMVFAQYQAFRGDYYAIELLKGFGICIFAYMVVDDLDDIKTIQSALLGCFFFMAVWGFEQQLLGNARLEGLGGSAWGDSNGVAAMFILFLPVALAKAFASENRRTFWIGLTIASCMAALVVCTKSRAGLIAMVFCLTAFGFYARRGGRIILVSLVLGLAATPFITQQYLQRMDTITEGGGIEHSAKDRITLWEAGLMVFADNPLVGTGFLTYPEAKMKYENRFPDLDPNFRAEIFRTRNMKVTHNTYIQFLSDCGLAGALPFIFLVIGGIFKGVRARRLLPELPHKNKELIWLSGISAGITGYAVCMMSIDAGLDILFYCQLVFASILYRKVLETEETAAPAEEGAGQELAGRCNAT